MLTDQQFGIPPGDQKTIEEGRCFGIAGYLGGVPEKGSQEWNNSGGYAGPPASR